MKRTGRAPRSWYWDAIAAAAFTGQALFVGKLATRIGGPFAGLFVFLINAGLAYYFGRAAWRALLEMRDRR